MAIAKCLCQVYYGKTRAENSSSDLDSDEVLIKIDSYPPVSRWKKIDYFDYFDYFYVISRVESNLGRLKTS